MRSGPTHLNNPSLVFSQPQPVKALAEAPQPVAEPTATGKLKPSPAPTTQVSGNHQDWMRQAGIAESDFAYVDYIVSKESNWNFSAINKSSGAFGLCQSLPAEKMASAGGDWRTSPVTQLKWCAQYAQGRYGSWAEAHAAWLQKHWW